MLVQQAQHKYAFSHSIEVHTQALYSQLSNHHTRIFDLWVIFRQGLVPDDLQIIEALFLNFLLSSLPLGATDSSVEPLDALVTEIDPHQITFYDEITHIVNDARATYEIRRGNCQKYGDLVCKPAYN